MLRHVKNWPMPSDKVGSAKSWPRLELGQQVSMIGAASTPCDTWQNHELIMNNIT